MQNRLCYWGTGKPKMSFHSLSSDSLYAEGDFGNVSENTEAEQLHKLALTPVVIGLCILLLWTSIESFRHQKLRLSDPEVAVSSAGWELRRWFHLFLAISTFSRLVGVIVELCLPVMALESTTSISCWIIGLVHGIPDMLYLSTFCLVVSFFAKVYFTTLGIPSLNLYTLLLVANLSVYVSFVVVAVISLLTESYITLRVFTFAILAVSYAVAMSLMLGFGFRLSNQLRPRAESSFPDSDRLIARIVTMSVVLSFMLFVHMIHCIIALGALKDKMQGYPGGINR